MKNRIFKPKWMSLSKIQLWRALSARALTFTRFQKIPQMFLKVFHSRKSQRGRRHYHFGTYFGAQGSKNMKNRIFKPKKMSSSKIQLWRALSARALTFTCFQKIPQMFSKVFHARKSQRGRRHYDFGTYFGAQDSKNLKNRILKPKKMSSSEIQLWRALLARALTFTYFQNFCDYFETHFMFLGLYL